MTEILRNSGPWSWVEQLCFNSYILVLQRLFLIQKVVAVDLRLCPLLFPPSTEPSLDVVSTNQSAKGITQLLQSHVGELLASHSRDISVTNRISCEDHIQASLCRCSRRPIPHRKPGLATLAQEDARTTKPPPEVQPPAPITPPTPPQPRQKREKGQKLTC
jgi:hypothetical protein